MLLGAVFLAAWIGLFPVRAQPQDWTRERAEQFLRQSRGLERLGDGGLWLAKDELQIRSGLASLADSRREIIGYERSLEQRILDCHAEWERNLRRIASLKETLKRKPAEKAKQKQLEKQIRELQEQAVPPDRLGGLPDVRRQLMQLITARQRLCLALLAIQQQVPRLPSVYAKLAKDASVSQALAAIGPNQRLGPAENGYRTALVRVEEFRRHAFTMWVPAFLQSGQMRVGAILDERTPITCSWSASHDPLVLTASMAEAAGIQVPAEANRFRITLPSRRVVHVYRVRIPAIRLGAVIARDVEALVLPPEAEDAGARISIAALPGYVATSDLPQLQLRFRREADEP